MKESRKEGEKKPVDQILANQVQQCIKNSFKAIIM